MNDKIKLTLATSIDPEKLNLIYDNETEEITNITILTVDYKPIELFSDKPVKLKKNVSDFINIYDVAALIIKYIDNSKNKTIKTKFIIAQDVVQVSNSFGVLVMLNGKIDIIPDNLLTEVYKNFSNLKTVNLEQLEEVLEISKNQPALKAYNKLSSYFSVENYANNNNVFKLIQHQNDVIKISKKVLLKSIVAWEIRK